MESEGDEHRRSGLLEKAAQEAVNRIRELEAAMAAHLEQGRVLFGCAIIADFLYWPRQEDVRAAFCVPLIVEREHLNIEVMPLSVYHIDHVRGLDFLEPVPEAADMSDADPRLEAFFATGRPDTPRTQARH